MTSKRTRRLDAIEAEHGSDSDEAHVNLWAAIGTVAQTTQPVVIDAELVATAGPRTDRWTQFKESA